jgi:hypothetical protein
LVEVALNVFLFRILIIVLYFGSHTHISCLGLIKQVIYFLYFRPQVGSDLSCFLFSLHQNLIKTSSHTDFQIQFETMAADLE